MLTQKKPRWTLSPTAAGTRFVSLVAEVAENSPMTREGVLLWIVRVLTMLSMRLGSRRGPAALEDLHHPFLLEHFFRAFHCLGNFAGM